jgi:mannose/cellobiose epimerase-like protein (N-acyl-D-glucosamine 2-epimerase family)
MKTPATPAFENTAFLQEHVQSILDFYEPRVLSPDSGFHQSFLDNGEIFDAHSRQLVGSSRFVVNYATAYRLQGQAHYLDWAHLGLNYLQDAHRQTNGHYAWLLHQGKVADTRVMAYGHAFVLLAAASCVQAGIESAKPMLNDTWDFMERYFWDANHEAYADERDASLTTLDTYRGQNANMHMCEALLCAWQATNNPRYLDRAELLATRFTFALAEQSKGLVWEHYTRDWNVDFEFNKDKPNDRYKPWGFQPGHQVEWCKLLLILHAERPDKKWPSKARELFDRAMQMGWDEQYGGIVYGVAPEGQFCSAEKYFWVHAEAFAAAWRLYQFYGEDKYLHDYQRIWMWSWKHLIDHKHGAWYRVRNRDGSAINNQKSPLGKADYHTLGACWDVLSQNPTHSGSG